MASSATPRSVAGLIPACSAPMRFAGIMRLYSRLAMHHEYTIAWRIDQCLNLRCRYHAHVMIAQEPQRRKTVKRAARNCTIVRRSGHVCAIPHVRPVTTSRLCNHVV